MKGLVWDVEFEREQIIEINNTDYYVVDVQIYEGETYLYLGQMEDDDILDKFYVYKYDEVNNVMVHITNSEKLKVLLRMFVDSINKELEEM